MTVEVMKFTKIWLLICAILQFSFGMAFTFFWGLFFADLMQFPFTDPALPLIFGTAAFGFSAMCFLAFFEKEWKAVKIPILTEIIWGAISIPAMLYAQYGIGLAPINWINTLSYALVMGGSIVAFILQYRKMKAEM
ncbi:MAG: hypothetical protein EAX90_03520 [Candidatus Heimdallarchaeota archaeon]|nr:hypothetical protein [Candidatus Heimdallarchaeota archaeon]